MNSIVKDDLNFIYETLGEENKKFNDCSILITGCAGFLGHYFINYFFHFSHKLGIKKIVGLDTFLLGKPDWIVKLEQSRNEFLSFHSFDISQGDLNSFEGLKTFDFVIHAASIASPSFYRKFPVETIDGNIWGLRNLLEFYKTSNKLKGFLFFSSSEIYGDPSPESIPTNEEYRGNVSCHGPRACYDESKRFGETICYVFSDVYNMPITVARPFNNYGPGMSINDKRLPADLAKSILNQENIILFSDGKPTRTFCYISDAIVGYLKCLLHGKYDYFNIGNDNPEISVLELSNLYVEIGKKIIFYKGGVELKISSDSEYLKDNPNRRCPDLTKSRKLLNYSPQIGLELGIEKYLKFLIQQK
jgi:UDP-glucuronate decarboxylase